MHMGLSFFFYVKLIETRCALWRTEDKKRQETARDRPVGLFSRIKQLLKNVNNR